MQDSSKLSISAQTAWALFIGLGLGLLFGVMIASGFGFDKSEMSRFVGSFLGSLIAISGAVSLYFLQESYKLERKRTIFRDALERLLSLNNGIVESLEKGDGKAVTAHLEMCEFQFARCQRTAKSFELDDERASMIGTYLDTFAPEYYKNAICEDDEYANAEILKKMFKSRNEAIASTIKCTRTGSLD